MSGLAKACLFLGIVLTLAAVAWVEFLPAVVQHELRDITGFDTRVSVLTANPFTGRVVVEGLTVTNPHVYPVPDFVDVRAVRADVNPLSWAFGGRRVITDLDVDFAKIELIQRSDGKSNAGDFMAAFMRRHAGDSPGAAPNTPAPYLVKRLHVRLERLVAVICTGSKQDEKSYDLHIDETYNNVTDARQLLVPEVVSTLHAFGLHHDIARLLPGDFGKALALGVGGAAQVGTTLKDGALKTGDAVKGLIDKLEQSPKP